MYANLDILMQKLSKSDFRSRFHLKEKDKEYVYKHGMDTMREQAREMLSRRVGDAEPENDGKQTPMKGHPVFISQHATACCCRGCIEKWHRIEKGHKLSEEELEYLTNVIMKYIENEMVGYQYIDDMPTLFDF